MKFDVISAVCFLLAASVMSSCGEPDQMFSVRLQNENGEPLPDVEVKAWFKLNGDDGGIKDYSVDGLSNADGRIELSGETLWAPTSIEARKEGYYLSTAGEHWTISRNSENRWEPWPVEVNLIMKRIVNPQPMHVAKFDGQKWLSFPEKQLGPFGFDLMDGDWVAPHGVGRVADFVLHAIREDEDAASIDPKGRVILTFSNAGDGVIQMTDSGGSVLVGPTKAPVEGYEPKWEFVNWKPHATDPNLISRDFSDEVYVFRVRTQLDAEGNVIRANYGKIHGRILGKLSNAAPRILMTYYFNGRQNDLGIEWDMESNLIEGLPRAQWPEDP